MGAGEMKSLAHKDWPYTGTAWEWRGFGKADTDLGKVVKSFTGSYVASVDADGKPVWHQVELPAVYQKQNLGPELT